MGSTHYNISYAYNSNSLTQNSCLLSALNTQSTVKIYVVDSPAKHHFNV